MSITIRGGDSVDRKVFSERVRSLKTLRYNRRPIDYDRRKTALKYIREQIDRNILALIDELFTTQTDGRIKLFLTFQLLQARKTERDLFQQGNYIPLEVTGEFSDRVIRPPAKVNQYWLIPTT